MKGKNRKSLIKLRLLMISIVLLVIGAFIIYLVVQVKNESSSSSINNEGGNTTKKDNTTKDQVGINDDINPININSNYYTNPIGINIKEEVKDEKNKIKYIEISGLSNVNLVKTINEDSIKKANDMYDSIKDRVRDNQRIETIIVIVGSYGNQVSYLLSMNIIQDDTLIDGVVEAISFNLINGEKVTIDDVIIPKKEIGNIIKENIRESVLNVFRLKQQKYNKIYTLDDLENEIANIVNQYENNELQIAVSPNTMYITNGISEYYYEISLENIYKNVIIYNRYNTTKSLYDGTYIRKGPYFVFEEADILNESKKVVEEKDNYYINIYFVDDKKELSKDRIEIIENFIDDEIENLKKDILNDKDNFYIVTGYFNYELSKIVEGDFFVKKHIDIKKTIKQDFDMTIKSQIRNSIIQKSKINNKEITKDLLSFLDGVEVEDTETTFDNENRIVEVIEQD